MTNPNYIIRTMNRDEINLAVEWAAAEGWNPGLYDADSFYAADPQGFLIGEIDNQAIATISAVKYVQNFGFLGCYIVQSDYRGQGYGLQIWNAALDYLKGRNIGLDGVIAQQENYQKVGFKLAYRNIRYQGVSGGKVLNDSSIVNLSQILVDQVIAYDRPFFPGDRTEFLKSWLNQRESIALGIIEENKLLGYGVIRPCRSGYKIGPLFADNPTLAESLFLSLKFQVEPQQPLYLDTPEVNREAIALAEKQGMKVVFETARMYTGEFPNLPFDKLFGVTNFELG
jgi:GNAT superfamily N-acetyltransferase